MGLTATGYKIHNNKITIDSVYMNLRDIRTTKENIPGSNIAIKYSFSCTCYVKLDDTIIDAFNINVWQDEPILENPWSKAYTLLKEKLTEKSISFTDSI